MCIRDSVQRERELQLRDEHVVLYLLVLLVPIVVEPYLAYGDALRVRGEGAHERLALVGLSLIHI